MINIVTYNTRKAGVTRQGVALFNARWPTSSLRDRPYWFEFDEEWNLIDTDCPQQDDGPAASALAEDIKAYLRDDVQPEWIP
jgi:hypothetical protein